ncbi:MAG: energy transducer TonB [Planctomycetota bacterium]|jgi:protein TonB|nr:energy transducer TonB [Planctomycetota bacterium]
MISLMKLLPSPLLWLAAHRYAVAATVGSLTFHAAVFCGILANAAPSPREFTAAQFGIVAVDLSPAALAQIFPAAAAPETSTETPETPKTEPSELAKTPAPEIPPLSEPPTEAGAEVAPTAAETAPVVTETANQPPVEIVEKAVVQPPGKGKREEGKEVEVVEKAVVQPPVAAQNYSAPSAQSLASEDAGLAATTSPEIVAGSNRRPTYPEAARRRRQEGTVWLRLEIDARGDVRTATVDASSGYPLLDDAAVRAARQWRFRPATRFGQPAAGTVSAPVEFHLR